MSKFDRVDLAMTLAGDLIIENGDLKLAQNQEFVAQTLNNRVRSNDPEWYDHTVKNLSANLEDLRGRPNTADTAAEGVTMIATCLTRDGFLDNEDLYIRPVPFDRNTIAYFVFINTPFSSEPIGFEIRLNLMTGVIVRGA